MMTQHTAVSPWVLQPALKNPKKVGASGQIIGPAGAFEQGFTV